MGIQPLSLREFIRSEVKRIGVDKFKHQFGVTESTVNHWARGWSLPRPWHMEKIVKLSQGRVSYATMIETFNRTERKRRSKKSA